MKHSILATLLIAMVCALLMPGTAHAGGLPPSELTEAVVIAVIDGDTIEVYGGYRVRLIGIDAPEIGAAGADEATEFVRSLLYGRTVWLERDGADTDPYGRLRRYVWLQQPTPTADSAEIREHMVNARMLENGLARLLIIGEVRHAELFRYLANLRATTPQITQVPTQSRPTQTAEPFGGFTPGGTATVVDNATDSDGIEFFTFQTPEGNTFFLVIDRNRAGNNVYFLNAVTEWDLMALAVGEAPPPLPASPPQGVRPEQSPYYPYYVPEQHIPHPMPDDSDGASLGRAISEYPILLAMPIIVVIAVVAVVYLRIIRPKKQAAQAQDDDEDLEDGEDYDDDEDNYGDDHEDYDDLNDDEDG